MQKKYLTKARLLYLLVWVALLIIAPYLLISFGVVPSGTALYPMGVIFPLLGWVLFKGKSIRVGVLILSCLALLNLFRIEAVSSFLDGLDHRLHSSFFVWRGPLKPGKEVVIVDIDHKSLSELGQWPWPRTFLSRVIENVSQDQAKVIGLDIVFPSEDHQSLKHFKKTLNSLGLQEESAGSFINGEKLKRIIFREYALQHGLKSDADEMDLLEHFKASSPREYQNSSQTIIQMGKSLHSLYYLNVDWKKTDILEKGAEVIIDNDKHLARIFSQYPVVGGGWIRFPLSAAGLSRFPKGYKVKPFGGMVLGSNLQFLKDKFPQMKKGYAQVLNHEVLQDGLNYQGAFNIVPEASGAARYYSLAFQAKYNVEALVPVSEDVYEKQLISENIVYPSLALEMLRVGEGADKFNYRAIDGLHYLTLIGSERKVFIPITPQVEVLINFMGYGGKWEDYYSHDKEHYFSYYSFSDVMKGRFDQNTFKDKYILIGSTDPTLSDLIGSPFRAGFPGIEVHATMLDNITSHRIIADYDYVAREWKYFGLILFGFVLVLALSRAGPMWGGVVSALILVLIPVIAFVLMTKITEGMVFSFSYEWLSILILSAIVLLTGYFETSQERKFLQEQFGSMVSPRVLAKLQADPEMQSLKGSKSDVTVVFSDIADFTSISENLSPQDLVRFLNEYLTPMSEVIVQYEGFIDKYIGDAIMSCWGVPFSQENHAYLACKSIVEQRRSLKKIAPLLEAKFGYPLYVRFGVASGIVSSAMVGSKDRKNYTVLGDVVNTAARFESLGKVYGVDLIVSHDTYKHTKNSFVFRKLDYVIVKGKTEPVYIYELLDEKEFVSKEQLEFIETYEAAFEHYTQCKWDRALALLRDCRKFSPGHLSITLLESRVNNFIENPPKDTWNGEFEYFQK